MLVKSLLDPLYNIEFRWDVIVGLDGVMRKWLCSVCVGTFGVERSVNTSRHNTIIPHPDAHHRTISIPLQRPFRC